MDYTAVYGDTRERILKLVADLPADAWARAIPGCPDWTVRDMLAHNVGVAADSVAGRLEGAPGDEWTRAHIATRAGHSVDELVAEWADVLPAFFLAVGPDGLMERMARTFATDLVTHEYDLRGALGEVGVADEESFAMALKGFAILFSQRVAQAGLPALRLTDGDWSFVGRDDEPEATLTAPRYEIFRGLSGRRSRGQVAAFDWSTDPAPYLDLFNNFGPLPDRDVLE